MIDQRIHSDEVYSENRDELFSQRLADTIEQLQALGFYGKTLKQMITVIPFVRAWLDTPRDFYPAKTLPKGYKWSDGKKYQYKAVGNKSSSETYIFLPVGDDLYIKGMALAGTSKANKSSLFYIKNFREKTAAEITIDFSYPDGVFFCNCIHKFWKEQGLRQGLVDPILRDLSAVIEQRRVADERREEPRDSTEGMAEPMQLELFL